MKIGYNYFLKIQILIESFFGQTSQITWMCVFACRFLIDAVSKILWFFFNGEQLCQIFVHFRTMSTLENKFQWIYISFSFWQSFIHLNFTKKKLFYKNKTGNEIRHSPEFNIFLLYNFHRHKIWSKNFLCHVESKMVHRKKKSSGDPWVYWIQPDMILCPMID